MSDWRDEAVCRYVDPDLFFPVGDEDKPAAQRQIQQAKTVCESCPVAGECLAWALDEGQDAGVWGGMTPGERRALRYQPVRS